MTSPFPRDIAEFDDDERIAFDKVDNKYILEDENGVQWEFNEKVGRWTQTIDEEDIKRMQEQYVTDHVEPEISHEERRKKRKAEDALNKAAAKAQKAPENRAVYVTNLPLDATKEEITEVFTRFGGMIAENEDDEKRITMYTDDEGNFKGEALVVYFKRESVPLALRMLDDNYFRSEEPTRLIKVTEADMAYKRNKVGEKPNIARKDRKKLQAKQQEMAQRLADWSDDEPAAITPVYNKHNKTVIFKGVFTIKELDDDPALTLDIAEEMREDASQWGEVSKVTLFDREPEGIATIRFKDPAVAAKYAAHCHGREVGGQIIRAYVADEKPKFKKSGQGTMSDEEEEAERLERFGNQIEADFAAAQAAKVAE